MVVSKSYNDGVFSTIGKNWLIKRIALFLNGAVDFFFKEFGLCSKKKRYGRPSDSAAITVKEIYAARRHKNRFLWSIQLSNFYCIDGRVECLHPPSGTLLILWNDVMRMPLKFPAVGLYLGSLHPLRRVKNKVRQWRLFAEPDMNLATELEYVGFWPRIAAALLDLTLLAMVALPILYFLYERSHLVLSSSNSIIAQLFIIGVLPPVAITAFWIRRHATPGKMAISAIIIDEKTAGPPSVWQHVGRYCAYFLSVLPAGLGFLWIAFDPKKQAWHDRLAGTLVVRIRQQA